VTAGVGTGLNRLIDWIELIVGLRTTLDIYIVIQKMKKKTIELVLVEIRGM
jgi:hypothetical protein